MGSAKKVPLAGRRKVGGRGCRTRARTAGEATVVSVTSTRWQSMDTALILGVLGLLTTLGGTLGAPRLAARSQHDLNRLDELRSILDGAAVALADREAEARGAWRALLALDIVSDPELDDMLKDEAAALGFPQTSLSGQARKAVLTFGSGVDHLRPMTSRLALRLGESDPAVQAFSVAHAELSSVATTMLFAADGVIAARGDDVKQTLDVFFDALEARSQFLVKARALLV